MSRAVTVENLHVRFDELEALAGVSLGADYGRVLALLGPNGAGKTTLVETLLGFRSPDGGSVRVHGLDPRRDHADVVARTGALLQHGGVWFPMTPQQVLHLTAAYYPEPRQVEELIDALDLTRCQRTPWRRLSGGEQQRTALALALVGRPKVLVLDEPTTAVDPEGRRVVRDIIRAERERGCAVILTTHELREAELLADDLVVLHRGRILAEGDPATLAESDVLVLEVDGVVDANSLSAVLGASVEVEGPVVTVRTAPTSEAVARASAALAAAGLTLRSLRTRASLEERYLDLISDQRREES